MLQAEQVEELIHLVTGLDRPAIIHHFQTFHATFPIDFTREFLETQPLDRLRHVFLALCLQQQRLPQMRATEAA